MTTKLKKQLEKADFTTLKEVEERIRDIQIELVKRDLMYLPTMTNEEYFKIILGFYSLKRFNEKAKKVANILMEAALEKFETRSNNTQYLDIKILEAKKKLCKLDPPKAVKELNDRKKSLNRILDEIQRIEEDYPDLIF